MSKRTILLVEDELSLANVIKLNLSLEGFNVIHTENGRKSIDLFKTYSPDLVILDIMLPEMNGLEVCRHIKKNNASVPVLFLSAKSTGTDRIDGLKSGADDYLVKPFNLEELLLRVHILLKRYPETSKEDFFRFGNFTINFSSYTVTANEGHITTLSAREMQLLKLLTDKENQVVSRDEIIRKLWSPDENPSSRTIDNFILNFRKLFEEDTKNPKFFHSVRGIGYKFTSP